MGGASQAKVVIICGPTASGKTGVGIELARRFSGEIVSADSQQVWRGFDIGTAKANLAERSEIPHHLIDVVEPEERFDAARFVALADAAIADIAGRGRIPLVVGGTGMYLRMLLHGLCDAPPRDAEVRAALEAEAVARGMPAMHGELRSLDPETAAVLHPHDRTRIVRALEIYRLTGVGASAFRRQHGFGERRYDALSIGLVVEPADLSRRIDARVDRMIVAGLVDEVRNLLAAHDRCCQPFHAVGYREIVAHLRGEMAIEEAVRLTKRNSRRFAKRQRTWFRADREIRWFDPGELEAMAAHVAAFLQTGAFPR